MIKNFTFYLTLVSSVFVGTSILSCIDRSDSCEEISCFTPPPGLYFQIVDDSGDNVFSKGLFDLKEVTILDLQSSIPIEHQFQDDDLIQINSIGWQTETRNLELRISENKIFSVHIEAERLSENCCDFTRYNIIEITGVRFEIDSSSGNYIILIEMAN